MNLIRRRLETLFSLGVFVIAIVLLARVPGYAEPYTVIALITILMYVILTLSWSIFSGPTHYISLATAAFFGVGIYVSAVIWRDYALPVTVAAGGLASFGLALVIGLLTLRLKGIYFILFTFGVSALVRHSLTWWETHKSRTVGRYVFGPDPQTIYYYLLGIAALTLLTAYIIRHSRFGLALKSIGENEEAAAHIGINVTLVKVLGFAISAIFMGATGAIMANRLTYIDPTIAFNPLISFLPVVMAIFGGTSRLLGPIVGAAAFTILREYLITEYPYYYMLAMGTTLIVVILYLPDGLFGLVDRVIHRLNRMPQVRRVLARLPEL
ncbi:MAG: branched-chain amino acid ABC transporter permease [Anaerolineae bacterium]|nr:branched-chain amino acid ABC transporter permease [Anaerolineae bacterium]